MLSLGIKSNPFELQCMEKVTGDVEQGSEGCEKRTMLCKSHANTQNQCTEQ